MNNIVALPQLAAQFAAIQNIDTQLAEEFISNFFGQIENALTTTESVSIKGLGSFARTNDAESPIKFTPDANLAATVNEPFEIFSPIEITDGIDFTEDSPEVVPSESAETPSEPEAKVIAEAISQEEPTLILDTSKDSVHTESTTSPQSTQPTIIIQRQYQHNICFYVLAFVTGLLIGGVIGYSLHKPIIVSEIEIDENLVVCDSIATENTEPNGVANEDIVEETLETEHETIEPVYDTITNDCFLTTMARKYYDQMEYWVFIYQANSDILGHPNRIKPGTKVRIPDKSEFIISGETTDQTIQRAKDLGKDIYAKYL